MAAWPLLPVQAQSGSAPPAAAPGKAAAAVTPANGVPPALQPTAPPGTAMPAAAVELVHLQATRRADSLDLDFVVRLQLPRAVEEALQRGVPVYFVAQAQLKRSRWYWRDERIARVQRSWRVAYQPLTSTWRVALGGLSQTHASLAEALAAASRSAGWRLADPTQLDADQRYTIEFSYRLDSSQLPGPMQLGLGGQNDWALGVSRVLRLDLRAEADAPPPAAEPPAPPPAEKAKLPVPAAPPPTTPPSPPGKPPGPAGEPRPDPRLDAQPLPRPDDKTESRVEARPS